MRVSDKQSHRLETDWDSKGEYHIDLWTGSNTAGGGQNQIDCEDRLPGGSQTIILDPSDSLPVDSIYLTPPEINFILSFYHSHAIVQSTVKSMSRHDILRS